MTDRSDKDQPTGNAPDLAENWTKIAEQSQRLLTDFTERLKDGDGGGAIDPLNITNAFFDMTASLMKDPAKLAESQMALWQGYMDLWHATAKAMTGQPVEPVVTPESDDRRFKDAAWQENPIFDFIKQSYLLTSRWMIDTARDVDGLDDATAKKVDFYTRQFADALAPTNFALTNPEVLRETAETKGENLVKGLGNLLDDLERGKGRLHIKMVEQDAFQVGENIAASPGKVVFQTDLMQLIQYEPTTEKVRKRPLLIVPPWINKFYILDLREKNSFIRWATGQGHTVFVVSWVNPDTALADKTFEDYMLEGPVAALEAVEKATGEKKVNVIGYCIGGTLMACTLAYLASKRQNRVASVTFFTTMVDFTEAGELSVFIDEEQLGYLEEKMSQTGYLEGSDMATTFNMMRANDLIWSFVVNNYLMGKDPFPFDLLYWNSDSTRMPAAMHSFYLRRMYQENKLVEPGGIELAGVKIDLGKIKIPTYILSAKEDHIAPWASTYAATQIFQGQTRFVLSASGHVAGVINPPAANKYHYWTNDAALPADPEDWLHGAEEHPGSWWTDWDEWVAQYADGEVDARQPGDGGLKAIENAPGSYVMARADEA